MSKFKCSFALFFLMTSTSLLHSFVAHANDWDEGITFDFKSRQIQFFGVYAPGTSQPRVQGLDAEIAARRNGISRLNKYLENSCGEKVKEKRVEKSSTPSWQGIVKSQGSEIYSNGVLKISLVAPIKEILKDAMKNKSSLLKTKDGVQLALSLPKLPASALKCGLVTLSLGGREILLNPFSSSGDPSAKTVTLLLDGASAVKPAGSEDTQLLEASNLVQGSDSTAEN